MPELPEVETIRRQLAPLVNGRSLEQIEILDARWCMPLEVGEFADALVGRVIERLERRGKYLLWELAGEAYLLMHLRMTGTLLWEPPGAADPPYTRVRIRIGGQRVVFADPRRFGTGQLALGAEALERFLAARIGVEPLGPQFTGPLLRELARGRRVAIKPFLLDQRHIAGVGNIYADEALFRAGIHPLRAAGALRPRQYARLRDTVVEALSAGIDARGATIDDFRDTDGARGSFQNSFLVHRRAGEPCPVCGRTVRKLVVGGRGTYVCERCQPRPRLVR
jgi:formamidopyrimidine-DNA glycosylase